MSTLNTGLIRAQPHSGGALNFGSCISSNPSSSYGMTMGGLFLLLEGCDNEKSRCEGEPCEAPATHRHAKAACEEVDGTYTCTRDANCKCTNCTCLTAQTTTPEGW